MILFREPDDGDTKTKTMSVNVASSSKKEKQDIIEQAEEDIKQIRKQKTYSKLKQFYLGSFDLRLTGNEYEYLQGQTDKMIHRGSDPNFRRVADMLIDGNVIFANLMSQNGQSYLKAIYIMNLTNSDTRGRAFEPKRVKNRDGEKMTCYYRYISTELDLTTNTFKEAIANNNYRSNECFINSIYDTYKDTLFNDNRKQYITRDDILSIIGKTENEVIHGLSIEDMLPFFVNFRLSLRVFNKFYKMFFKYDPPVRNHHAKAMYCMMTDNHIYTLNHNVKTLQQLDSDDSEYNFKTNSTYSTNEEPRNSEAKMINNIDDILTIMRDTEIPNKDDKKYIKLVHRNDDLIELLQQFINAGYSPGISFDSGRITALKVELKKVLFSIETQQLIKSAIDGVVVIDNEQTYNNMANAMNSLNCKLFLKTHKSYYTNDDITILDQYRTKPIVGMTGKPKIPNLVEIDISRAYTSIFSEITKIPVFNEFDNFKEYNNEPIEPYSLYIVVGYQHPLITQSHNLMYGQFVKPGMTIRHVKQPSFIKNVS